MDNANGCDHSISLSQGMSECQTCHADLTGFKVKDNRGFYAELQRDEIIFMLDIIAALVATNPIISIMFGAKALLDSASFIYKTFKHKNNG